MREFAGQAYILALDATGLGDVILDSLEGNKVLPIVTKGSGEKRWDGEHLLTTERDLVMPLIDAIAERILRVDAPHLDANKLRTELMNFQGSMTNRGRIRYQLRCGFFTCAQSSQLPAIAERENQKDPTAAHKTTEITQRINMAALCADALQCALMQVNGTAAQSEADAVPHTTSGKLSRWQPNFAQLELEEEGSQKEDKGRCLIGTRKSILTASCSSSQSWLVSSS